MPDTERCEVCDGSPVVIPGANMQAPLCAACAARLCACGAVVLIEPKPMQMDYDGLHTRRACVEPNPRNGDRTLILRDGRSFDRPGLCLAADREQRDELRRHRYGFPRCLCPDCRGYNPAAVEPGESLAAAMRRFRREERAAVSGRRS